VKNLLWIDCIAGAAVGVAVLALLGWLSRLYAVPPGLLLFTGIANLAYASYSFTLARRQRRAVVAINTLIVANFSWALVCVYLVVTVAQSANIFGIAHLAGEAVFVASLAALEWRWRKHLLVAPSRRRPAVAPLSS
jgi:hypothetical protein